jgi:hypothetical protein
VSTMLLPEKTGATGGLASRRVASPLIDQQRPLATDRS